MIYIIYLARFIYAITLAIIVYVIMQQGNLTKNVWPGWWAFLSFILFIFESWIEFKITKLNSKSITTNRHAFREIRIITFFIPNFIKPHIGKLVSPFVNIRRGTDYGLGGSSKFESIFEHWKHLYKQERGDIFLGCSVWDNKVFYGQFDDKSGITFSEPRNGKGTSFIIPNLRLYQGSVLVMDGKNGENLDATGSYREKKGRVLCIDPYGKSKYGKINGTVRFNPLTELDPNSPTIIDDLSILSDAIVIKSDDEDGSHFTDGGERLIKALIAHMISSYDNPNLSDLRGLIIQALKNDSALFDAMSSNTSCHGIIQEAAVSFTDNTPEIRNFMSNAIKTTEWLTSPLIREVLSVSDFSFQDLKKQQGTSIYLVLDADTIETNAPFLRLFVNLAIRAMRKNNKPKIPVLFLLDEFYSLGKMDQLSNNISEIPGYGIKLWPVMHHIGQLEELYDKNWKSFLGGTQVYFGLNQDTAKFVEAELGARGFDRKEDDRDDLIYTNLLSYSEIIKLTSNHEYGGNQIVIRSDGYPLLLKRVNYFSRNFNNFIKKIYFENSHQESIKDTSTQTKPIKSSFLPKEYLINKAERDLPYARLQHILDRQLKISENVYFYDWPALGMLLFETIIKDPIIAGQKLQYLQPLFEDVSDAYQCYGQYNLKEDRYCFNDDMPDASVFIANKLIRSLHDEIKLSGKSPDISFLFPDDMKKEKHQSASDRTTKNKTEQTEEIELNIASIRKHWRLPEDFSCEQVKERYYSMIERSEKHEIDQIHKEYFFLMTFFNIDVMCKSWRLPLTFTQAHVKELYPIMLEHGGKDDIALVNQQYIFLMIICGESEHGQETRYVKFPERGILPITHTKQFWQQFDWLVNQQNNTEESLAKIAYIHTKKTYQPFDKCFVHIISSIFKERKS